MNSELSIFAARLREHIPPPGTPGFSEVCNSFEELFPSLALELFALQFQHNAAYRKLCEARGKTPDNVRDWKEIPAMPAAAFKELELTSLAPADRTAVFHSSGTTEQKPSRHFHNAESLATYETSLWAAFAQTFQLSTCDFQLCILTPPPAQAPHSSLVHMFETVRQKLGGASVPASRGLFVGRVNSAGAWELDFDATLAALQSTINQQPSTLLLGTAFSFVHFLDFLAERNLNFKLPPGSRVLETGGYKNRSRSLPKDELHTLITERLGVPASHIVCEYGMSELSSQAYATSDGFRFPPWARAQIVSPETGREVADGETGLIRVFDLANVFSVAAIQTEDLAIRRGDGFELLGRAQLAEPRGCSLMTA